MKANQLLLVVPLWLLTLPFLLHKESMNALPLPALPSQDTSNQRSQSIESELAVSRQKREVLYAKPIEFYCKVVEQKIIDSSLFKKNVPTTIARVDLAQAISQLDSTSRDKIIIPDSTQLNRDEIVIYHWSAHYSDTGETGIGRCRRVSSILNDIKQRKALHLIKFDQESGSNVICLSSREGGPCTRLIFTLGTNLNQDVNNTLSDFFEAMKGLAIAEKRYNISSVKSSVNNREAIIESNSFESEEEKYQVIQQNPYKVSPTRNVQDASF